jgi:polyhydroxybutyrate depolymerase
MTSSAVQASPLLLAACLSAAAASALAACSSESSNPIPPAPSVVDAGADQGAPAVVSTDAGDGSVAPEDAAVPGTVEPFYSTIKGTLRVVGGTRPAKLYVPPSYKAGQPMPLLVLLHGYGASGSIQEAYFDMVKQADTLRFLLLAPDGTTDQSGKRFWNATPACCNFFGSTVDDEGYLLQLINEVQAITSVEAKRIVFLGHSNGGFMTYRMACNHADRIAAVGVLSGGFLLTPTACAPSEPVSQLHAHGDADETVAYAGGQLDPQVPAYSGAQAAVARFRTINACTDDQTKDAADFESTLAGSETQRITNDKCSKKTAVSLWTIQGGSHIPTFNPTFTPAAVSWLLAHPKQ